MDTMDTSTDNSATTLLSEQNYLSILGELLPLVDGTTVYSASNSVVDVISGRFSAAESNGTEPEGFTFIESMFNQASTAIVSQYTCDADGSAERRMLNALITMTFTACNLDDDVYDGIAQVDFQQFETNFSYTELIITGPSGTTRLDGVIEFTRGRNGSAFFSDQIQLSFTEAEVSGATLTNYNVTLSGSGDTDSTDALQPDAIVTRRLSSNFSLTADYTGGAESPIEVMTLTEFVGVQPDAFYTTGMLAAEASDGSALELQADNGNPETLQTTINTDAGTTSFADPWDENIRLRCLDNTNDAAPSEFQFSCGN